MHRHHLPLLAAIAVAPLVAAGCGSVHESLGVFTGDGRDVALVLDLGFATVDDLVEAAGSTIDATAREGGTLRAFVVTSGSHGSLTPVRFGEQAGHGNFEPEGRNRQAWNAEAAAFANAARGDIADAVGALVPSTTGRDLVGGVNRAAAAIAESDGSTRQVVLVTGGGVQQNATVDLVGAAVDPENAVDLATAAPLVLAAEMTFLVVGAGRFTGLEPPPSSEFVAGVEAYWHALCAPYGESCRVATFGDQS